MSRVWPVLLVVAAILPAAVARPLPQTSATEGVAGSASPEPGRNSPQPKYAFTPAAQAGFQRLIALVKRGGAGRDVALANVKIDRTAIDIDLVTRSSGHRHLLLSPLEGTPEWHSRFFAIEPGSGGRPADARRMAALLDRSFDQNPLVCVDRGLHDVPAEEPVETPAASFAPEKVYVAVSRVKNILIGLPATDVEAAAVAADSGELAGLVGGWMAQPEYRQKMLEFLSNAFQQTEINWQELVPQFIRLAIPPFMADEARFVQNLAESFGRTAMELIAEGKPFTSTMTTRRFMMTPALMLAYALLDDFPVQDGEAKISRTPAFLHPLTLESARPISLNETFDPASPDFLTFYDPAIAVEYQPGCPTASIVYPGPVFEEDILQLIEQHSAPPFIFDSPSRTVVREPVGLDNDGGPHTVLCTPPNGSSLISSSDFGSWRMVSVRQPGPGEARTKFYDLAALRSAHELVLNIPRVGFFTTISFLGQWATNQSNLARVTANQTMIVGLGLPIDTTNSTVPGNLSAVDGKHSAPDTDCYLCHQSLDPMRQFFRQAYTLNFSRQLDPVQKSLFGEFAFHGVAASSTSIFDLGEQLAGHPLFASAWVQKLCTYANSTPCDEKDPEFLRLVGVFVDSGYSWDSLVKALFASPIATGLESTTGVRAKGPAFPIARQAHLCATLSMRLGIADVCGLDSSQPASNDLAVVRHIASGWPSDGYSRGSPVPVLANDPSLFIRTGLENICSNIAGYLIDNPKTGQFDSAQPLAAMRRFVSDLMGLRGQRAAAALPVLQGHFSHALAQGADATTALRSTFVLACISPYVAGVGL